MPVQATLDKNHQRIVYNSYPMQRKILNSLLIFFLLFISLSVPQREVKAEGSVSTGDMINMVNSIRTGTYGLPALVESAYLDSCAQWTAEEMAAISASTHLAYLGYDGASARCANFGFGGGKTTFVTENWAMHTSMTLSILQSYWADTEHMYPMTKAQYNYVGAGIATSSNGRTYYVLQAGSISGETAASSGSSVVATSDTSSSSSATDTSSQWMSAVVTSTASADGMIYHTVLSGQTLFYIALAYGVTVDYLKELNNLTSDSIMAGQQLKIMAAPTATVTPTRTATLTYPTRTPTLKPTLATPTPMPTATPTPVPSLVEKLPKFDRQMFGLILVILSGLGLLGVVLVNFIRPKKEK